MHELKDQQSIIGTLAKVTNSSNAIIVELECAELVLPHDPDLESRLQSLIGQEVVIKKSGSVYRVKELK
jgi:hypothetical protein